MHTLRKDKNFYAFSTLILLLLGLIIFILILASVPPVDRDGLSHHLAVPKLFLKYGMSYENPSLTFSYYPMNIDLLYMIPLYFKNDIVPKYIHFFFALLTALFIFKYLEKYAGRIYGLLGALFFLSTPVILRLSVSTYVDLGLIFFSWVCLYYFLMWRDNDFKIRYLIFSSIACGLALGTKYNGLLLIFIVGSMTPLVYSFAKNHELPALSKSIRNRNSLKGLGWGLLFFLVAIMIFSPWMIRNYALKNNPVYPLYKSIFNSSDKQAKEIKNFSKPTISALNHFALRRNIYHETFLETVSIPIRIFFQGKDGEPKYFDGKLNPFLLFFSIFAFWGRGKKERAVNRHKTIFFIFISLFILIALFTVDMRIRYIAPVIPPLVVLSIFGIKQLIRETSRLNRNPNLYKILVAGVVAFAFFLNGKYLVRQFCYIDPFSFINGKIDRDHYISRYRVEYPILQYANRLLPEDAKVLCLLIGKRTYYLDRNFVFNSNFFQRNDRQGYSEAMLVNRLKKSQATHVIFGLNVYQDWARNNLNHQDQVIFNTFLANNTRILYEINGYQLLEIVSG